jgi:hypothetical protein
MKKVNNLISHLKFPSIFIVLILMVTFVSCKNGTSEEGDLKLSSEVVKTSEETLWHIKAIHPEGRFLDIKAVDAFGSTYDVYVIQRDGQKSIMDIKAYVKGKILPIKILVNEDKFAPVKAISEDGSTYNIMAIAPNGDRFRVKGVQRLGNIIDIKAIDNNGEHYGIKAISPNGQLHDVKGIKMKKEDLEYSLHGLDIYAHVKALPQTGDVGDNFLWHIVAIHPDGYALDVRAIDSMGNDFDVKAILDAGQRSLLDVKTFVEQTQQLPVKMLISDDIYKPVVAIGQNGEIYNIIITTLDGDRLDVKGVKRLNNIIDIKVLDDEGTIYAVKAISPKGELNDVKGIKLLSQEIEMRLNGHDIYAHVKALPQAY